MDEFAQFEDGDIVRATGDGRYWLYATPFGSERRAFVLLTEPDNPNDIGVSPSGAYTVVIQDPAGGWTLGIHAPPHETQVFAATMAADGFEIVGHRPDWRRGIGAPLTVTPTAPPTISPEQLEEDAEINAQFRELMSDSDFDIQL